MRERLPAVRGVASKISDLVPLSKYAVMEMMLYIPKDRPGSAEGPLLLVFDLWGSVSGVWEG